MPTRGRFSDHMVIFSRSTTDALNLTTDALSLLSRAIPGGSSAST